MDPRGIKISLAKIRCKAHIIRKFIKDTCSHLLWRDHSKEQSGSLNTARCSKMDIEINNYSDRTVENQERKAS